MYSLDNQDLKVADIAWDISGHGQWGILSQKGTCLCSLHRRKSMGTADSCRLRHTGILTPREYLNTLHKTAYYLGSAENLPRYGDNAVTSFPADFWKNTVIMNEK